MPKEPRNLYEQGLTPTTTTDTTGGAPPIVGAPPLMGPQVPPITPMAPGLRGVARLQSEINASRGLFSSGMWGHDFNLWVLSLKDDPSDPEYSMALQWAKANAQRAEEAQAKSLNQQGQVVTSKPSMDFTLPATLGQTQTGQPGTPAWAPPQTPVTQAQPATTQNVPGVTGMTSEDVDDKALKQRMREQRGLGETTQQFVGSTPPASLLGAGNEDENFLSRFMSENGQNVSGPEGTYLRKSGAFVFTGTITDNEGRKVDRYMYYGNAKAGLVALGRQRIAEYQSRLGLEVTGIPDAKLQNLWEAAVEQAQVQAQAGVKITVQEIFDSYVFANEQARKRGGGGGGGGGGAQDLEPWDYYRAMMAVMGDISGVSDSGV